MPSTSKYPFKRLSVDHMVQGTTRVWWQLEDTFADAQPHTYQLQYGWVGSNNAVDWADVGSPAVDTYTATDDEIRLRGNKVLVSHYRVKLTTSANVFMSQPVGVHGELNQKDWSLAREIIRKERLRMKAGAGREGFLIKRFRRGTAPAEDVGAVDFLSGGVIDDKSPTTRGTPWLVGYHPPIPLQCWDLGPRGVDEKRGGGNTPTGQSATSDNTARVIGFPMLAKEDVWVDANSDERWVIHQIKNLAEIRGVPLIVQPTLSLLPFGSEIYQIDVNTDDMEEGDLPTSGTGSVEIEHNFGGANALSYLAPDGCAIAGGRVLAFTEAAYIGGARTPELAAAASSTTGGGRWAYAMLLNPGNYVLVFDKVGEYGPDTASITVV